MAFRLTVTIIAFLLFLMGCLLFSLNHYNSLDRISDAGAVQREAPPHELMQAEFYLRRKKKPFLNLLTEKFTFRTGEERSFFEKPSGDVFMKGKTYKFLANSGEFNQQKEELILKGKAQVDEQELQLKAELLHFFLAQDLLQLRQNVKTTSFSTEQKLVIEAAAADMKMNQKKAKYWGKVHGIIERKEKSEPKIFFAAEKLFSDLKKSFVLLEEQASFKKAQLQVSGERAELFLENYNKNLKYYVLYNNVKVVEKIRQVDGTEVVRKAYSEKLEGYVKEERIVLTGTPKVIQGEDIIKGNTIVLRENSEIMEVKDSNSSFILKEDL